MKCGENSVELTGTYGGDLTHALSAWTSTSRELTDEKRGRMRTLLHMLAKNGHHSVFEKSAIHFLVTCDTVTHYQMLKHRIGVSINVESARYKELLDDKCVRIVDWNEDEQRIYEEHLLRSYEMYHSMVHRLVSRGVDKRRAKESARFLLPMGNQLVMDVMFNFRSFMHFIGLRNKPDAQKEIRDIASTMLSLVVAQGDFNDSLDAFDVHGVRASLSVPAISVKLDKMSLV